MSDEILTIFCSFTRGWAVERWISNLVKLNFDPKQINLAFIVDIDDPRLASRLVYLEESYLSFSLHMNRQNQPNEVRPLERRKRIAEVKRQSKALVARTYSNFVLALEDDTVFDSLDINRLIMPFREFNRKKIGIVEGVQCGRWGKKMIGAWKFDNIQEPNELISLLPKKGYQEIDAGGFYGYLIPRQLYLDCPYEYSGEAWGPDVNAGLWLRRQGYTNFIDWETKFGHNDHNVVFYPDSDIVQQKFIKRGEQWLPVVP